jgi:hypothetical protein
MRINFINSAGARMAEVLAAGRDHWDACLIGHDLLENGVIDGAVDFIVEQIAGYQKETEDVIDCSSAASSIWGAAAG